MFYATTALLGSQGLWRSKHHGLIAAFGEYFVKTGLVEPNYGRMLRNAFEARLDSDYAPHPDLAESSAKILVVQAGGFVERILRSLTTSDDREKDDVER